MQPNPFLDKASPPDDAELRRVLARAATRWSEVTKALAEELGPLEEQWVYSGAAYGWSLRLRRGKRTVLYLLPRGGGFLAAFALGEKACAAARASRLPPDVLTLLDAAPRFAEGRAIRIPVRSRRDIAAVRKLAAVKLSTSK